MLQRRFRVVSRRLQTKPKQRHSSASKSSSTSSSSSSASTSASNVAAGHIMPRIARSRRLGTAAAKQRAIFAWFPSKRSFATQASALGMSDLLFNSSNSGHSSSGSSAYFNGSKALLFAMTGGALLTGTLALNHRGSFSKEQERGKVFEQNEFMLEHPNLMVEDPSQRLKRHYHMYNEIGAGSYATVRLGKCLETGELNAIKILDAKCSDAAVLEREISALKRVKSFGGHRNIIDLQDVYMEGGKLFVVTELVRGGELFDHLNAYGAYDEESAKWLAKQIAEALGFLHHLGIVHKDLKPENILLASTHGNQPSNVVKLVDFGSAGDPSTTLKSSAIGTSAYLAPESITTDECTFASDLWAFGCVLYVMLTGCHPFDLDGDASELQMLTRIQQYQVDLDFGALADVSPEAKDLLARLLDRDPTKRPTADELLSDPWFKSMQTPTRKQVQMMAKADKPHEQLLRTISGVEESEDVTSDSNVVWCYCT